MLQVQCFFEMLFFLSKWPLLSLVAVRGVLQVVVVVELTTRAFGLALVGRFGTVCPDLKAFPATARNECNIQLICSPVHEFIMLARIDGWSFVAYRNSRMEP